MPTETELIVERARDALTTFVDDPKRGAAEADAAHAKLPPHIGEHLDRLLRKPDAYRDGLVVALAVPLVRGCQVDITERTAGGRAASDRIGGLLRVLHIRGVAGAYQNIAKNSKTLVRGNNPSWDAVLRWGAAISDLDQLNAAYIYVVAKIAATARTVRPRPPLRVGLLNFGRVMHLLDEMFDTPTAGAHEQYVSAALLEAVLLQEGTGLRMETKALNASDKSSHTAGDIQVFRRGRLQEGIETSANPWDSKAAGAEQTIREFGLPRVHILADLPDPSAAYAELAGHDLDVSVLRVRDTAASMVALLDKAGREAALIRVYDLLDQNVASPDLVNAYVDRLRAHGLAADDAN